MKYFVRSILGFSVVFVFLFSQVAFAGTPTFALSLRSRVFDVSPGDSGVMNGVLMNLDQTRTVELSMYMMNIGGELLVAPDWVEFPAGSDRYVIDPGGFVAFEVGYKIPDDANLIPGDYVGVIAVKMDDYYDLSIGEKPAERIQQGNVKIVLATGSMVHFLVSEIPSAKITKRLSLLERRAKRLVRKDVYSGF